MKVRIKKQIKKNGLKIKPKLLNILKDRFEKKRNRHTDLGWDKIQEKLAANPEKLLSQYEMEKKGLKRHIRVVSNPFLLMSKTQNN